MLQNKGRYYSSGQYAPVDNPDTVSNSDIGLQDHHAAQEHPLNSYNANDNRFAPTAYEPTTYERAAYQQQPYGQDLPSRPRSRRQKAGWSRRRKLVVWGGIALVLVIVIAVAVGVGVSVSQSSKPYNYTPLTIQVTNDTAFGQGATKDGSSNLNDGIGAGEDKYTYYSGDVSQFPASSQWVSFGDMWNGNLYTLKHACKYLKAGKNNNEDDINYIYSAIQNRAAASLVDHRFIFAVILQESHGCPRVGSTTSQSGVTNPGLMQSHNGHEFSDSHANASIYAMVQDGTQGTGGNEGGDGLVQNLDLYGNAYSAARGYNSGYVPKSGNLSEAAGATACYVSDIANRLTGWANATSTCPGDTD